MIMAAGRNAEGNSGAGWQAVTSVIFELLPSEIRPPAAPATLYPRTAVLVISPSTEGAIALYLKVVVNGQLNLQVQKSRFCVGF